MRGFLIYICMVFCAIASVAKAQNFDELIKTYFPSGDYSIALLDLETGKIVRTGKARKSLPPASVMKIPTALYALENLGSNFKFRTRVLITTSNISDGILKGDVILAGGGNPTLDTDGLVRMASDLAAFGVRRVEGEFYVYEGALPYQRFLDPGQLDFVSYNPAISGLNLNFNRVFFEWKAGDGGYELGLSAKTKTYKPTVRGVKIGIADRKGPVYKFSDSQGVERWSVAREALGKGGNRWLPVRDPAIYAGEIFRYYAKQKGVDLPAAKKLKGAPKGDVISLDLSATLDRQLRSMLKFSTNLSAETIGMTASIKAGNKVTKVADSARAMQVWFGTQTGSAPKLLDHSGLNVKSRMTAENMVRFLAKADAQRLIKPLLKEVELRNAEWKKAPLAGTKIVAKTGTLNFTSALAGYIDSASGKRFAFAIFTHDSKRHAAIPKDQRDRATGARSWARKSRILQHQLLRAWASR